MRFLLSIHDVWPGNYLLVAEYLEQLRAQGARHFALLVVPFYHGQKKMEAEGDFLAWLHQESRAGTEIFLHGYYHLMPERVPGAIFKGRRSAWGRWINQAMVNGEAEFCGLGNTDKLELLQNGLATFEKCQLLPLGIVAPTWFGLSPTASLGSLKVRILESRFFIFNLENQARKFAPPLAWNQSIKDEPSLVGGRIWLQTLLRLPLIKIALHPGDLKAVETSRILDQVLKSGEGIHYGQLFSDKPGTGMP